MMAVWTRKRVRFVDMLPDWIKPTPQRNDDAVLRTFEQLMKEADRAQA